MALMRRLADNRNELIPICNYAPKKKLFRKRLCVRYRTYWFRFTLHLGFSLVRPAHSLRLRVGRALALLLPRTSTLVETRSV